MKYKIVREFDFAGFEVKMREWWNPFWRRPSSWHNPTYWTKEQAQEAIERMKERRKK